MLPRKRALETPSREVASPRPEQRLDQLPEELLDGRLPVLLRKASEAPPGETEGGFPEGRLEEHHQSPTSRLP